MHEITGFLFLAEWKNTVSGMMKRAGGKVEFIKQEFLFDKIVFIDGLGLSGKFLFGPILSTYQRVELHRTDPIYDYVGALYHFGKISLEGAVTLLQYATDEYLYNGMIGRNVNFRPTDYSSIERGMNYARYYKRVMDPTEGDEIVKKILKEKPIFQNLTHDLLGFCTPHFEAFGKKLHILEVVRHPFNLVDRWMAGGWGENRYNSDPSSFVLAIKGKDGAVPYFARAIKDRYSRLSPIDRVINDIYHITKQIDDGYRSLPLVWKKQVLFVQFEDFVTNTKRNLKRIASFLKIKEGKHLNTVLKEERCPRKIDPSEHDKIWKRIKPHMSKDGRAKIEALIAMYNSQSKR